MHTTTVSHITSDSFLDMLAQPGHPNDVNSSAALLGQAHTIVADDLGGAHLEGLPGHGGEMAHARLLADLADDERAKADRRFAGFMRRAAA